MTKLLVRWLQSCFTSYMTATRTRETIYDKAERILGDPERVIEADSCHPPDWWSGDVVGDHGRYGVTALSPNYSAAIGMGDKRVVCTCRAGRVGRLCSHMIVGEEMRLRGGET